MSDAKFPINDALYGSSVVKTYYDAPEIKEMSDWQIIVLQQTQKAMNKSDRCDLILLRFTQTLLLTVAVLVLGAIYV